MFPHLERVIGPECKRCGCRDCMIISEPTEVHAGGETGTGQPWITPGSAICRHCNQRFTFVAVAPPESRPLYAGPQCPECGCGETKCTHTYPPKEIPVRKRRHVCKQCGSKFVTESAE